MMSGNNLLWHHKLFHMLQEALEIIYAVFGGEENVEYNQGEVTVRLQPFLIKNELGQEHKIKGMWIKFDLSEAENAIKIDRLLGERSAQTSIEYKNNYRHSHLQSGTLGYGWSGFCQGSGQFHVKYSFAQTAGCDLQDFHFLMMLLKHFISYEDVDNPYKKINALLPLKSLGQYKLQSRDILKVYEYEDKLKQLEFNNAFSLIDSSTNHDILLGIPLLKDYRVVKVNGQFAEINTSIGITPVVHDPEPFIDFKGEQIYTEILPDPEIIAFSQSDQKYLHPDIFKQLSDEFQQKIKSKLLFSQNEERIARRKAYCNSIRELSVSDQIPVFKNL